MATLQDDTDTPGPHADAHTNDVVATTREDPDEADNSHQFDGHRLPLPMVIAKMPGHHEAMHEEHEEAALVKLMKVKASDGIDYFGVRDWPCSIAYFRTEEMPRNHFLPSGKSLDAPYDAEKVPEGEVKLLGFFSRLSIAPAIKLSFHLHRGMKNRKTNRHPHEHNGNVLFFFNTVYDHKSGKRVHCIRPGTFEIAWKHLEVHGKNKTAVEVPDPDEYYIEMSFVVDYAVVTNFNPPPDFPSLTSTERDFFKVLGAVCETSGTKVNIRLYPFRHEAARAEADGEVLALQQALEQFPALQATTETPVSRALRRGKNFFAYKPGSSERANVRHNAMFSRHTIVTAQTPFVAIPAANRFIDNTHGEIALGYGHHLDFIEECKRLKALENDTHVCTVHSVADSVVIAIRLSSIPDSGLESNVRTLHPNTKLELHIEGQAELEDVTVRGITTDLNLGVLPPSSIHVLVNAKYATTLNSYATAGLQAINARRFKVRIDVRINDSIIASHLDAIHKAYDVEALEGSGGNLLPLLLYDGLTEGASNPWAGCSNQELAKEAIEELKMKEAWTPMQAKVIDMSTAVKFRTGLVAGCGGSGKTLLQVHKGHAAVKAGDKVAYISTTDIVLDTLCKTYVQYYPDDEPPVRAYAMQLSVLSLADHGEKSQAGNFSEEELAIWTILEHKRKIADPSLFEIDDYSVEGHIRKHLQQGTVYRIRFTDGETESGDPVLDVKWPEDVDVFTYLRDSLRRINSAHEARVKKTTAPVRTPLAGGPQATQGANFRRSAYAAEVDGMTSSDPLFSPDEWRWMGQAWRACRRYVLANAKVLLCTAVNCGSREVRRWFASGDQDRVWLEVDEATTIHEASLLTPLAQCYPTWGHKIVSIWMYGDLKQFAPSVHGSNGDHDSATYNEFGAQIRLSLFLRLIRSGFPFIELTQQARMHSVLWEHVNRIFYDIPIASLENEDKFALEPGFESMVRELFHHPKDASLSDTQLRLAYFELPGPNLRRSSESGGSRANMANFLTVMNLIKGPLRKVYQHKMNDSVALITPYARQRRMYISAFARLRLLGWSEKELPLVTTVDSAAGVERDHVILDYVVTSKTHGGLGFMRLKDRACVAFTRARKVLWIVGSDFFDPKLPAKANPSSSQDKSAPESSQDKGAPGSGDGVRKKKSRNHRVDLSGQRMADSPLVEYRSICDQGGVLFRQPKPTIHENDWPADLRQQPDQA